MIDLLQSYWYNFLIRIRGNFDPVTDILDIVIVTFLIYQVIALMRQTHAVQLAKGSLVILAAYAVASVL